MDEEALAKEFRDFIWNHRDAYYGNLYFKIVQNAGTELSYDSSKNEWCTSIPFEYTSIKRWHDHGSPGDSSLLPKGIRGMSRSDLARFILKHHKVLRSKPPEPSSLWEHLDADD